MEKALLTAAVLGIPTIVLVIGFKLAGRKVEWVPLLWAGFACLVYFLLLRSRGVLPSPDFLDELNRNWFGKTLAIAGTVAMLYFLPRVDFRDAGVIWKQNEGSLGPVMRIGAIVVVSMSCASYFMGPTPNTSVENLLWQATMPGIDEELFFRGLLLLLLHQAFGRGLNIFGAETGWGFWLVIVTFGLLHGVTIDAGDIDVDSAVTLGTGFMGFVLTWMRERTGSLVVPVLFHNVSNVAGAFV